MAPRLSAECVFPAALGWAAEQSSARSFNCRVSPGRTGEGACAYVVYLDTGMYTVPKLTDYSPAALDKAVAELTSALEQECAAVTNEAEWKALRDRWMARKNGVLTQINDLWLKAAPGEAKREVGRRVNELRTRVEKDVATAQGRMADRAAGGRIPAARVDITLPGIRRPIGARHPVLQAMNDVIAVFKSMGYSVEEGPEVETDYYNFEALNFPPDHPARDTQDTIFLAGQEKKPARERLLLRTHTSPVQIRTMQKYPPPVRVVCPRSEEHT